MSAGVTNLRALLAREKDEDTPRLNILLCEAFVASYMSLVTYALATCDCHILYRLAGQKFTERTWALLFGGGVKKLLKVAQSSSSQVSNRFDGTTMFVPRISRIKFSRVFRSLCQRI